MGRITAIHNQGGNKKRVNIFVDGDSLILDKEVACKADLQIGQELTSERIEELKLAELYRSCLAAALHYLSYRPRSEAEVIGRLYRHGFGSNVVDRVIVDLKEQKLVDDDAFARYWTNDRLSFSPRSQRLIQHELRQKGVAGEIVEEITKDLEDQASAYEAARKRGYILAISDYGEFRRRLSSHLKQRGFGYEVINSVIHRLWQEQKAIPDYNTCPEPSLDTNSVGD